MTRLAVLRAHRRGATTGMLRVRRRLERETRDAHRHELALSRRGCQQSFVLQVSGAARSDERNRRPAVFHFGPLVMVSDADDFEAMTTLLEYIADSFEKLDVLVHLYRVRPLPLTTQSIGHSLELAPQTVTEVLEALAGAGIVRAHHREQDGRWWFDPGGGWARSVDVVVELYDIDRTELLALIKHVALQSFQLGDRRRSALAFARRRRDKPLPPN